MCGVCVCVCSTGIHVRVYMCPLDFELLADKKHFVHL